MTSFDSAAQFFTTDHTLPTADYAVFNFCQKISQGDTTDLPCSASDQSVYDAYATLINIPASTQCEAASSPDLDSIESTTYEEDGVEATLGLQYSNSENGCSLLVGLICDEDATETTVTELVDMGGQCSYRTTLTSADVCPSFDLNALWTFLDEYSYLWGVLFIVGGIFLAFFGRKLFKGAIFMATAILTVFAILLLFYTTFLSDTTESWVGWTVLVCSILIGLVAGFFMMKLERIGAALLAGWGGFLIGLLLNEMALYKVESPALFWSVNVACAVVAAVLSFFFYEHVLINTTAFGGSYMLIRGISFYAGGFPNEFTLAAELKAGDTSAFDNWFYMYMVCILIVFVVADIVQYKTNKKGEDNPYEQLK